MKIYSNDDPHFIISYSIHQHFHFKTLKSLRIVYSLKRQKDNKHITHMELKPEIKIKYQIEHLDKILLVIIY